MKRFYVILGVLFLGLGAAAFFVFGPALMVPPFEATSVSYDVNADGAVDLVRWDFNGQVTMWEWDRDGDGDGTVTDTCTGLMWQQDTADVNGDGVINNGDQVIWCDALAYCENLDFAGHDDWRLPNVRELQSIVDYSLNFPAIDPVFNAATGQPFWSSTSKNSTGELAWLVGFVAGTVEIVAKSFNRYLRAVRNAP